ncbi:MAG: N-acetyltransferase [Ignisphaera sp.]
MNSAMHIRIRPASEKDIDYVIAINIECLPEHYPLSFWLEHLNKYGDVFYVAEVDDSIVSYVLTRIEEGESFFDPNKKVKKGHIVSIAVREGFRRRGIATYLLSAVLGALGYSYDASEAYLEVRVSNAPAIKLYEKLGFVIIKRLEEYYLDGEDAYLMAKKLK